MTQAKKAAAFAALHAAPGAFVLPNPWDPGTARLLAHLGFHALATTSSGYATSRGKADYGLRREEVLAHIAGLAAATDLPLSADLENGFGDSSESAAETIRLAAQAGAVGGSIEDARREDTSGPHKDPIYDIELAADRIRAAAEAARSLPYKFTLTARAENYLHDRADIADTISRLQAYQEAGADVLYAPGLATKGDIAAVVASVDRPVNFLAGLKGSTLTRDEIAALGVKRISIGGGLARVAFNAFLQAATAMQTQGLFNFTEGNRSLGAISDQFTQVW